MTTSTAVMPIQENKSRTDLGGAMCKAHLDTREVINFKPAKDKAAVTFVTVYVGTEIKINRVIKPGDYGNKETWIEVTVLSVPKATRKRHPLIGRVLYLYWKPSRFELVMSADQIKAMRARALASMKADSERMAKLHDQYVARTKAKADAKAKAKK
jgi:hypothetical protein